MAKYLSAAIACGKLDVNKAVIILRTRLAREGRRLGLIAKDLGYLSEDGFNEVEAFYSKLLEHGIELPDYLAAKSRESFETKLPEFLVNEHWQLRQEIRDRLNSVRTILGVTVGAFTATVAATATFLSSSTDPSFFALSMLWLAPHAVIMPAMSVILAERFSILRMAMYIRLHIELPFFEAGARLLWPFHKEKSTFLRMPVGWESSLLITRWAAEDINDPNSAVNSRKSGGNPKPFAIDPRVPVENKEGELAFPLGIYNEKPHGADFQDAIMQHHRADRLESTSITYVMRSLSTASTIATVIFILLACFVQSQFQRISKNVGSGVGATAVIFGVLALSVTLCVLLWKGSREFPKAFRVKNFWGPPSLDKDYTERLIERFRDGR